MVTDAPQTKRSKLNDLVAKPVSGLTDESLEPEEKDRKRKVAHKRPLAETSISDLDANLLINIFGQISIADLCNMTEVSWRMKEAAKLSFRYRCLNGFQIPYHNGILDMSLLNKVLDKFGSVTTSIIISTHRE